jgi:hypothetical protein
MKTLNFFATILIAVLLITSCKDEEDGTPRQITKSYTFSQNLIGTAGVKGELPASSLLLADIIGTEPAKNFENAEMQLANSYLEVSGLSQIDSPDTVAVVLEDFTIKIGSRQAVNLGDCSTDPQGTNEFAADVQQSTNQIIGIIQNLFADVTSGSKSSTVTVSFTPSVSISSSDNVQLVIVVGGTYHYVELE